ncbi:MAG: hypothetical protein OEL76_10150 [Siculibacillus sp.]|nr:hypothetical protein [Siculibacillus sp.]
MAILFTHSIASFDDSHQPTGRIVTRNDGPFGLPNPHLEWKRLHHELVLTVEGPDDLRDAVNGCLQQAAVAAAIAGLSAAFLGAGLGATGPALEVFKSVFTACIGRSIDVRLDDRSEWIVWVM